MRVDYGDRGADGDGRAVEGVELGVVVADGHGEWAPLPVADDEL
jgi:hypothetical protein